jgi:hypothetical protein
MGDARDPRTPQRATRGASTVQDSNGLVFDREGILLADLEAAREECQQIVDAVLDEPENRHERTAQRSYRITDESGRQILSLPFARGRCLVCLHLLGGAVAARLLESLDDFAQVLAHGVPV